MSENLQETVRRILPDLLRADPYFRYEILEITRTVYAERDETVARFDRILAELQRDREGQHQKWMELAKEREREREEQNRKWNEQNQKWIELAQEREREREEQNQKWDQQMKKNDSFLEEIQRSRIRQEQALGAIGTRWGIASEHSFRDALKAILEHSFGVQVINYNDYDESGVVFGVPDQVEIDVIIKNGEVILCELKSSLSKSDIYTFERKVVFYTQRHQRTVTRKLVISPMIRPNDRAVAERLGIEVYSYADDAALAN